MKNVADLGGCYPPQPSASTDSTLLDLHNSSFYTQPHPIIANYFKLRSFSELFFSKLVSRGKPTQCSQPALSQSGSRNHALLITKVINTKRKLIFLDSFLCRWILAQITVSSAHWKTSITYRYCKICAQIGNFSPLLSREHWLMDWILEKTSKAWPQA